MKLWLADAAATEAAGAALGRALAAREGVVIYLHGNLGAGKTTLVRGMLRSMGATGAVKSPTYTLMEPYRIGVRNFLHLDLYRLNDPLEVGNLGLADFSPQHSWWLIEWPERGAGVLPTPDLELFLDHADRGRTLRIQGATGGVRDALASAGLPVVDN
jgi:tRNA threonylcarbamoyladenosine biosynthesis protein TsaE